MGAASLVRAVSGWKGQWEPCWELRASQSLSADPSSRQAWSSVFGFPFNIPRLRSPRLHANMQPLLPLLFSKKEKHCEKRLQRFLGSFQSSRGAALPLHAPQPLQQRTSPAGKCGLWRSNSKFLREKKIKWEFRVVIYTGLHSNPSAKVGFVWEFHSLGGCGVAALSFASLLGLLSLPLPTE